MNDYFVIGKIVNTQGVRGDVRIVPQTDDITRFEKLEKVEIFRENGASRELTIEKVWRGKPCNMGLREWPRKGERVILALERVERVYESGLKKCCRETHLSE